MSKQLTQQEFIEKSKCIHKNIYDYSLSKYLKSKSKIIILCKVHGKFTQTPNSHLCGRGCPKCVGKFMTTKEFIEKANKIHKNKYAYTKFKYVDTNTRGIITCKIHGEFKQIPDVHLTNHGCPHCGGNMKMTKKHFIYKAKIKHNNKYTYEKFIFINNHIGGKITCPIHKIQFSQTPANHLSGNGCSQCGLIKNIESKRHTLEEWIKKAKIVHKNTYDYSKVIYTGIDSKVVIICKIHGEFKQTGYHHLIGCGCPKCRESKGEKFVDNWLKNNEFVFERQKKFKSCKYKRLCSFDFYIPSMKCLIEYDGQLHFKSVNWFGGNKTLKDTKKRDKIKTQWAKKNGYHLIRLNYKMNGEAKTRQLERIFGLDLKKKQVE